MNRISVLISNDSVVRILRDLVGEVEVREELADLARDHLEDLVLGAVGDVGDVAGDVAGRLGSCSSLASLRMPSSVENTAPMPAANVLLDQLGHQALELARAGSRRDRPCRRPWSRSVARRRPRGARGRRRFRRRTYPLRTAGARAVKGCEVLPHMWTIARRGRSRVAASSTRTLLPEVRAATRSPHRHGEPAALPRPVTGRSARSGRRCASAACARTGRTFRVIVQLPVAPVPRALALPTRGSSTSCARSTCATRGASSARSSSCRACSSRSGS